MANYDQHLFRGLILESTFTSIENLFADRYLSYFKALHWLFLKIYWKPNEIVPKLELPILYIHGEKD